ncbi:hypothetical protein PIB30_106492 [Stylosanthes scabra]|uniref:Uncharacterized protein n=1 Tax=Stylosanthes scabra TaxID=79078 RepID=A0ABU6QYC7_9FABA|nr:hypothetical protein [Stylosanthes scabra]
MGIQSRPNIYRRYFSQYQPMLGRYWYRGNTAHVGAILVSTQYRLEPVLEHINLGRQIVVRLYPNGFPKEGPDVVEFHSPDPAVFMMWPVETLGDLQKTVLRNMRLLKRTPAIQMAYIFLALLPDRSCRYRVFWLINNEHVRAMFASDGRILSDQVMDLYVQILDTLTSTPG